MNGRARLAIYLNDHLAVSAAEVALARRLAGAVADTPSAESTRAIAESIAEDRQSLLDTVAALGIRRSRYKASLALVAERLGRFKPNGSLVARSPSSTVVELEGLLATTAARRAVWHTLHDLAPTVPELDVQRLDELIDRTGTQTGRLQDLHAAATGAAFD